LGRGKATADDYMVLGMGALNAIPGGRAVSTGAKGVTQLSKVIPGFTKFKGSSQSKTLEAGSPAASELDEYVKRPLFLHQNRNNMPASRVDSAILQNKYTIPKGADIVRVANEKDMKALALTKPGQSFVLDRFMSVTSRNSSEFLEGMRTGKIDTGGRSSGVSNNFPLLRFNVKTDIPGIYDINKILPGQAPSNVIDGLLARGQNMKIRKITTDKKTGQQIYDIDLGTNIKAKTGINQRQSQAWSDNLADAVWRETGKVMDRDKFMLGGSTIPQQMPRYYAMGGMVKAPRREAAPVQMSVGGMVKPSHFAKGGIVKPSYFAKGGIVKPSYFSDGGDVEGTDTVPAMLTPGEFVINRSAAQEHRPLLEAVNSGAMSGFLDSMQMPVYNSPQRTYQEGPSGIKYSSPRSSESLSSVDNSVYNYNLSVNVEGSNLSANDVANQVMNKIKQVDAQRMRNQVIR
jgi:hypothetical protein